MPALSTFVAISVLPLSTLLQDDAVGERSGPLRTEGLVIMLVSISAILTLLVWSYHRLLNAPPREEHDDA